MMLKKGFLVLILLLIALSACQAPAEEEGRPLEGEPFAIYLISDPQITSPDLKNYDLDELPLAAEPLLVTDELIGYNWELHTFDLTQEAYFKLITIFSGGLPMSGLPFAVVAYEEPIYAGAFWALFSSLSFDGVVILQPTDPAGQTMQIALGYPGAEFFTGEDPRGNPRLQQALEDAGLIRE